MSSTAAAVCRGAVGTGMGNFEREPRCSYEIRPGMLVKMANIYVAIALKPSWHILLENSK